MTTEALLQTVPAGRYKWIALSNTSLGSFMASLDASIIIVSLPAIFRGIHLDPLAPENVAFMLWMIMGYLLVTAVLVVTVGRLGDMFGRVRIYNAGFVVFTAASIALSFDPAVGEAGAMWLILWRVVQAVGGSMLLANSVAILTDAFPPDERGMALGVNQISALSGQFIGLVAGGLLAAWDWRAVFWINVPVGVFGTIWAKRSLRERSDRIPSRIDWWGNLSFASGTSLLLAAITYGIQPYGGRAMGWTNPLVLLGLGLGIGLLGLFGIVESHVAQPMFDLKLLRIRAYAIGGLANLLAAIARGGLQFMLIIWLQGLWLPLHGYRYESAPLWSGIFLLPLTGGILLAGPAAGRLSDRYGSRLLATSGLFIFTASLMGLACLPVDFPYWAFAILIAFNGIGSGMFAAPNTSSMMSSVPTNQRGVASGMRQTLQNSGTSLAIGVFFSLLIVGMSGSLSADVKTGLRAHGYSNDVSNQIGSLSPGSTVFGAFLGADPLTRHNVSLPNSGHVPDPRLLSELIAPSFHTGLSLVFGVAALVSLLGTAASSFRSDN